MSKQKDYRKFYGKSEKKERVNEPVQEETKEVQATEEEKERNMLEGFKEEAKEIEEAREERHCEAPAEEQKAEDLEFNRWVIAKVVGAKRVNMRCDASKDAPVLTVLSEDEEVRIIEKSSDGVWSRIKYNNKFGFMMSQFLKEI